MSKVSSDLKKNLQGANVVPLTMAYVHLTGDTTFIDQVAPHVRGAWDHLESVPKELADELRSRMVEALEAYKRGKPPEIPTPDLALAQRMMSVAVGEHVDTRYVHMLSEHMGMHISGLPQSIGSPKNTNARNPRINAIIIGAGASGICAAIALQRAGIDFMLLEKNREIGGTWYENKYPGCAVDTPNHFYQFSFEPNNDWPNYFSRRDSIQSYLEGCVQKYKLRDKVKFDCEVISAEFDEARSHWTIQARHADGARHAYQASLVIYAVGQLNRPFIPDFKGAETFGGDIIHTAQWPDQLDVTGKRVALVGTGASAIQVGPAIADHVEQLHVLQRSGSWISRRPNIDGIVSDEKKWALNHVPFYAAWYRFQLFWAFGDGLFEALKIDPQWNGGNESINQTNALIRQKMIAYMESELKSRPDLLEKVIPTYPPFGKRVLGDPGWFRMLCKHNVALHNQPIDHLEDQSVVLSDGTQLDVDLLVCATGFRATDILSPINVTGRKNMTLQQQWSEDGARAYLGITVPNFPNMFILFGPNTNLGHGGSAIFLAECQMRHVMGLIQTMIDNNAKSCECKLQTHDQYNKMIDERLAALSWSHSSVSTWYKNATGRIVTNQPWKLVEYWELTKTPNNEDYLFE